MTFRQLALSNIRGSALRYAAFFLSSVFSVMLFFVYAQFILHPDVASGYIYGGETTRMVLTVCLVLVAVFAFFFVLYSSGAFLRARNREFGLLTLMGTTRGQLRRLIWLENTFLSLAAILVGIGLGLLFSRLFLMGISRVLGLDEPIRFALVPTALLLTAVSFFLLFQLVTLVNGLRVGRRTVVELMKAARKPRATPRASSWLALLGALLVVGGYAVALSVEGSGVVLAFMPVVAAVVLGTHLLFAHGSVKFLQLMRRAEARYLQGTRMLVVSQLLFRVRDNARLFATIATLSAVVLASAGTFYITSQQLAQVTAETFPQQLTFLERPGAARGPVAPAAVDQIFERHAVEPTLREAIPIHELRYHRAGEAEESGWLVLAGERRFSELAASLGFEPTPSGPATTLVYGDGAALLGAQGGLEITPVEPSMSVPGGVRWNWYTLDDEALAALPTADREYAPATLWIYDWPPARMNGRLQADLMQLAEQGSGLEVAGRFVVDRIMREGLGLSLFAGVFVSLLFFIGAGSLIYFKLFTELEGDRRLFEQLRRLGITPGETSRTVTAQIAAIFLLPFALGGLHALVALDALGALLMADVVRYSLIVIGLFAAVQFAFFLLTRWTYLRALRPAG